MTKSKLTVIVYALFLLFSFQEIHAQAPDKMSFQAVVRDSNNFIHGNTLIGVKINILQGSSFGPTIFEETHQVTTNANGLFTIIIGEGTHLVGLFSTINWNSGELFIRTEIDPSGTGGTNYTITSTNQLLSVPYALHAKSADILNEIDPKITTNTIGSVPRWNGATLGEGKIFDDGNSIGIGTQTPNALLTVGENLTIIGIDNSGVFNTTNNKSLFVGENINNKGIMFGYDGNNIQGRFGQEFDNNGDLILNNYGGNVGIGTTTPSEKLEVTGKIKTNEIQVTTGAVDGYVLRTDAAGNTSWINPTDLTVTFNEIDPKISSNDIGKMPRWNGTTLIDGIITDNGSDIGIGTDNPTAKLDVNGSTKTSFLQVEAGAVEGYLMKTDNVGNATWVNPATISVNENDPQVTSINNNIIPKWNGTALVDGQVFDNGTNIGIGTINPSAKLDVAGNIKVLGVQLPIGANEGYVLKSDASGNAGWVNPNTLPISEIDPEISMNLNNKIPKWNGVTLIDGQILDNGTNVGVGTNSPTEKLDINGKTKTSSLQVTAGATNGYVLQSDTNGNGTWVNANTLSVTETDPKVATTTTNKLTKWNGTTLVDGQVIDDGTNIGIGTNSPSEKLDINGKTKTSSLQVTAGATNGYVLQSDTNGNGTWVNANTLLVTETDPKVATTTTNKLSKWNGTTLVDGQVIDDGTNIGIGTNSPSEKLDVNGKTKTSSLQVTAGATNGYVLQSDTNGNGTWVNANTLSVTETDPKVATTTTNKLSKWNGTTLVDGQIIDDGTNIGIGTNSPTSKLEVIGKTTTTNLQMTNGAVNGYILQSNASGNATWINPSSLSLAETDPQVSSSITNRLSKWSGTTLVDGQVFDNGTNVGIGTSTPQGKLHIVGDNVIDNGRINFMNTGNSVFVGEDAGFSDDHTSNNNVFVGSASGFSNTIGESNTYIGDHAAFQNSNGSYNVAIGQLALQKNTSNDNVALGYQSLYENGTGSSNVAIGKFAGGNNFIGSGNVFLGNTSGQNETGSNKLYIDNTNTSTPLIYGDFATNQLKINGTLNVNNAYNLPTNSGTANQVLSTDGTGSTSWANASTLFAESDPKITSSNSNIIPKWNGTALADGLIYDNGTNIGIGTTQPNEKLHISGGNLILDKGASTTGLTRKITIAGARTSAGSGFAQIDFTNYDSNSSAVDYVGASIQSQNTTNSDDGDLRFYTNDGTLTERMNITNAGNVGLGTSTPSEKLHIADGDILADRGSNTSGITRKLSLEGAQNTASTPFAQIDFKNFDNDTSISYTGASIQSKNFGGVNGGSLSFYVNDGTTAKHGMTISKDGRVGLGSITNPVQAVLAIGGGVDYYAGQSSFFAVGSTGFSSLNTSTYNSIYATNSIIGVGIFSFSDKRIKNVIGRTNNTKDLETLSKIKITDYKYIDTIARSNRVVKKLIAQELKEVYPNSVSVNKDFIPNIFKKAQITKGWITISNDLKKGDRVKMQTKNGDLIAIVEEANSNKFKINSDVNEDAFIYGKEVDDFHVVDYEAVSMLNVSATQELLKRIEGLEKENTILKQQRTADKEILKAEILHELKQELQQLKNN